MNKPLKEHYEDCNGQIAVFNYIDDLEKYIDYLVKLNLPVVSRSKPIKSENNFNDYEETIINQLAYEQYLESVDKGLDNDWTLEDNIPS